MPIRPSSKELVEDVLAEDAGFIHLAHVGGDLSAREPADGGLEQLFVFGEGGERGRSG